MGIKTIQEAEKIVLDAVAQVAAELNEDWELDDLVCAAQNHHSGLDLDSMFPYYSCRSVIAQHADDLEEKVQVGSLRDLEEILAQFWLDQEVLLACDRVWEAEEDSRA